LGVKELMLGNKEKQNNKGKMGHTSLSFDGSTGKTVIGETTFGLTNGTPLIKASPTLCRLIPALSQRPRKFPISLLY